MAAESNFGDLNYMLAASHIVPTDNDVDTDDRSTNAAHNKVPDVVEESDYDDDEDGMVDYKMVKKLLDEISGEFGIVVNEEMENYVLATSTTMTLDENSMRWFMAAMNFANNRKIIPGLESVAADLRTEIKNLQSINRNLNVTSTDIVKKMVSVKDEILTGFEGLRRNVIDKLATVPGEVRLMMEKVGSKHPVESDSVKKGKDKKTENIKSEPAEPLKPSTSKIVKDPHAAVRTLQLKLLSKLGARKPWINKMTNDEISAILPPAEASVLVNDWDSDEANEIKEDILGRVDLIEDEMMA